MVLQCTQQHQHQDGCPNNNSKYTSTVLSMQGSQLRQNTATLAACMCSDQFEVCAARCTVLNQQEKRDVVQDMVAAHACCCVVALKSYALVHAHPCAKTIDLWCLQQQPGAAVVGDTLCCQWRCTCAGWLAGPWLAALHLVVVHPVCSRSE